MLTTLLATVLEPQIAAYPDPQPTVRKVREASSVQEDAGIIAALARLARER